MNKVDLHIPFEPYKKANHYITGLIHYLVDEFDQQGTAEKLSSKYFNDASSKYYQMTPAAILEQWKATGERAIMIGSALDDYVAHVTEPEEQKTSMAQWMKLVDFTNDEAIYKRTAAWDRYWAALENAGWEMVGREIPLFNTVNGVLIGGRTDMIIYNKAKNVITIIDWKTADDIAANRWTKPMYGPNKTLLQDKATMYGLQVTFYKMALRKILPADLQNTVIETWIVQMKSDGTVVETKNNVSLTDAQLEEVLTYCVEKQNEANLPANVGTSVQNTFEIELCNLIKKYELDKNYSAEMLTKFIIKTIDIFK